MRTVVVTGDLQGGPAATIVEECIGAAIASSIPRSMIDVLPIQLDGSGLANSVAERPGSQIVPIEVSGPFGRDVLASIVLRGDTAVFDAASAAGPHHERCRGDSLYTSSTAGVGELIQASINLGARRIVVGCSPLTIWDGGIGSVAALGVRFLDRRMTEIDPVAGNLHRICRIDDSWRDLRLAHSTVELIVESCPPLSSDQHDYTEGTAESRHCELVQDGLRRLASLISPTTPGDIVDHPAWRSAGGLAICLQSLLGATVRSQRAGFGELTTTFARLRVADLLVQVADGSQQPSSGDLGRELPRFAESMGCSVVVLRRGSDHCVEAEATDHWRPGRRRSRTFRLPVIGGRILRAQITDLVTEAIDWLGPAAIA